MNTRNFAIFIVIMWIIVYVLGILFNNLSAFLYWIIGIAIVSIIVGIYHTFIAMKKLEEKPKTEV